MRFFHHHPLRPRQRREPHPGRTLLIVAVFLILANFAGAAWLVFDRRAIAIAAAGQEAQSLSLALAEQTARIFQSADQVLKDIGIATEAQNIATKTGFAAAMGTLETQRSLSARVAGLNQFDALYLVAADGQLINTSREWPVPERRVGNRISFTTLRDNPSIDRVIEPPVINRWNGNTSVVMARRISQPDGTFLGLVAASIQSTYFESFYSAVTDGKGLEVSLSRRDGALVARYPSMELAATRSTLPSIEAAFENAAIPPPPPPRASIAPRVIATSGISEFDLLVTVGRTDASVRQEWLGPAGVIAAGALFSGGLLLLGFGSLARQIARRGEIEAMLRRHRDTLEREVAERTQALAASEMRHRDIADLASDWFWELDANRRFTVASERFAQAAEIPLNVCIGKTPEELHAAGYLKIAVGDAREAIKAHRAFKDVTNRVEFPDGRQRYWRVSAKPMFHPETGRFLGYRGTGSDITASIEAEINLTSALSRAEAAENQARDDRTRLVEAIELLPAGFALWDAHDRLVICNARYHEIYGQTADLVVPGIAFEDLLRQTAARRGIATQGDMDVETWIAERMKAHRTPSGAFVQRRNDGRWIQVEERRTADGGLVGIYGDVTELSLARSRAEAAEVDARRDRTRLIDAIEVIPSGFALWDASDRLVMCNGCYQDIYPLAADMMVPGVSYEEVLREITRRRGQSLEDSDVARWVTHRLALRQLARHSLPGSAAREEMLFDGRWIHLDERPTSDGGIVAIRTDITEARNREATERDREKLAALGHLAGGVAHEINNLLQPAIIFPELITDRLAADDIETREDLAMILESARKARDIVKNILRFARKEEMELVPVDPIVEIKAALAFVRDLIPPTVVIKEALDQAPDACMVAANKTQLVQVITNLVINAAHAMKDHGALTIAATAWQPTPDEAARVEIELKATYLAIGVSDTGCGMNAETQARIFEPFFTTKPVGEGTGLGLSVVYGILRSWNGAITVASEPGKGTTFTLVIPILPSEAAPVALAS